MLNLNHWIHKTSWAALNKHEKYLITESRPATRTRKIHINKIIAIKPTQTINQFEWHFYNGAQPSQGEPAINTRAVVVHGCSYMLLWRAGDQYAAEQARIDEGGYAKVGTSMNNVVDSRSRNTQRGRARDQVQVKVWQTISFSNQHEE
jgi:hypothetical protein